MVGQPFPIIISLKCMHLAYNSQLHIIWFISGGNIIKYKILPLILLNILWQLDENLQDRSENGLCAMAKFSQVHCSHLDRSSENWHLLKMVHVQCSQAHFSYLTKFSNKIYLNYWNAGKLIWKSPIANGGGCRTTLTRHTFSVVVVIITVSTNVRAEDVAHGGRVSLRLTAGTGHTGRIKIPIYLDPGVIGQPHPRPSMGTPTPLTSALVANHTNFLLWITLWPRWTDRFFFHFQEVFRETYSSFINAQTWSYYSETKTDTGFLCHFNGLPTHFGSDIQPTQYELYY